MRAMQVGESKSQLKSLWKEKRRSGVSFLCPLCKSARVVPHKSSPGLKHFAQVLVSSLFLSALTWKWFEWKGIVSFAPLWVGFELVYRMRARVRLACPHCGFDPYLQLTDARRARQEIEAHWRKKFAEKGIPYPEADGKRPQSHGGVSETLMAPSVMSSAGNDDETTPLTQ